MLLGSQLLQGSTHGHPSPWTDPVFCIVQTDDGAILIIDIDSAQNDAIEFTLKDESCNAW